MPASGMPGRAPPPPAPICGADASPPAAGCARCARTGTEGGVRIHMDDAARDAHGPAPAAAWSPSSCFVGGHAPPVGSASGPFPAPLQRSLAVAAPPPPVEEGAAALARAKAAAPSSTGGGGAATARDLWSGAGNGPDADPTGGAWPPTKQLDGLHAAAGAGPWASRAASSMWMRTPPSVPVLAQRAQPAAGGEASAPQIGAGGGGALPGIPLAGMVLTLAAAAYALYRHLRAARGRRSERAWPRAVRAHPPSVTDGGQVALTEPMLQVQPQLEV
mmetsp:Transcript_20168/g.63684  ORF Transcript_20168/g.63684 Transcript_20168/m.63684 type:complete len:275 (-) Transcript_20168:140-964(-)